MKKRELEYFNPAAEDISLVLDSYEDIFSDFDLRSYLQRALSGDFLLECKKASMDKKDKIQLRFFIQKSKRNTLDEIKIKKRLKEHFHKHFLEKKREKMDIKINGFIWFVLGSLMILISAIFMNHETSFWFNLVITLTLPAGWFFMWEGLGKIFIISKEKVPDYLFYKKMVYAKVSFLNYAV